MIPYGKQFIDDDDIAAVVNTMRGDWLTQGPAIAAFEDYVKEYVGAKFAVAVSSASAGLHIASMAAGLDSGHTLVTTPLTFVATSNPAVYAGADIKFVDIDPQTLNMCPRLLKSTLQTKSNVKVISPVHFGGVPCDMAAIAELAANAGAMVVEDAAHSIGGTYRDGSRIGNCKYSDMTVFSFHPVKTVASGEGGMITTNNEELYRKLLRLRSHGINKLDDEPMIESQALTNGQRNPWYYEMQQVGFNYRITDIQCALGLSQMKKIDRFIERRRQLALRYDAAFERFENCRAAQPDWRELSGLHLYVIRIDFDNIRYSRAQLMTEMRQRGVGSQVHYIPVPMHPYYIQLGHSSDSVPNAMEYYQSGLSIPLYFSLEDEQQDHVVAVLSELVG